MSRKQINARLPQATHEQIERIQQATGMTVTQVLIMAVDRLAQSLNSAAIHSVKVPPADKP